MSELSKNHAISVGNKLAESFPVHELYTKYKAQVQLIRDVIEGSEVVKAKGKTYLPILSSQLDDDYKAYKYRAVFLNSTARIANTNLGTVIRRSPDLKYSDEMKPYFDVDTASNVSFKELFRFIVYELVTAGRMGILVDVDSNNNMPILIRFKTENIVNWLKDDDGNLISVLIATSTEKTDPETFETENELGYVKLHLIDGVYSVSKYNANRELLSEPIQPAIHGKTLDYLAFVAATPFGIDIEPVKSPIIDVAEVNVSHYHTSADLENGRHFVGLPQPVVTGGTSESKLHVGSPTAWVIPSDKAKAFYLEFQGQGLDGLAKALQEKEGQMAMFSAQLMDTGTKGSEAEGTVRMRYSSDAANLSGIAESTETAMRLIYGIVAEWLGTEAPTIELNKDFISDKLSYNELRELNKAWLDGGISDEEFRFTLKRGEILPSGYTLDQKNTNVEKAEKEAKDEKARLDAEAKAAKEANASKTTEE